MSLVVLTACNPTAPATSPSSDSTQVAERSAIQLSDSELAAAKGVQLLPNNYVSLTNLEMVEYCLPYPEDQFAENFKASPAKGIHVLESRDKQSKLTFSGLFIDTEFEVLYHDVQADVQEITMKDPLLDEFSGDQFVISWHQGDNIRWMKKWYRKDAGETVTAEIEYPASQSASYSELIKAISSSTTRCD